MPAASLRTHEEPHSGNSEIWRDAIIGFADGLTVPFAITAGLSSLGSPKLVIIGGLAELFSGAISMGLGAYLAAITERDHYLAEEKKEKEEVRLKPNQEIEEIYEIMDQYNIPRSATKPLVDALILDTRQWIQFMMDFELKLEKPNVSRAFISGGTMGLSYFLGGLVPMVPYFAMKDVTEALYVSIGITVLMLVAFGFVKNKKTVGTMRSGVYGAMQTLVLGAIAAGASYSIVRAVDSKSPTTCGAKEQ